MHRFIACALAIASCTTTVRAQGPAQPLTLAQAIDLARAQSPATDIGEAGVRAASAARTVAGLRPNPELTVQTENIAGTGVYSGLRSAETTAQFTLPLERGGKRSARLAVAGAGQERARIAQAVMDADVALVATQTYIRAVATQQLLGIAERQVDIAQDVLHAAQVRLRAGRVSPLEEQRARLMHINAQAALEQAKRAADVARASLGRMIGRDSHGPLDQSWFETLAPAGPVDRVATDRTLGARAAALDVASAQAQVQLASAQQVTDVQLFAGPRRLEVTDDTAMVVGISIPLNIRANGTAAVAQARAEQDKAVATRKMVEFNLEQAIALADAEVANAETAARIARGAALNTAVEAARIVRIGYREGKFGQLDLLDAERSLAQMRQSCVDSLAAYHDAWARRDRLTTPASSLSKD